MSSLHPATVRELADSLRVDLSCQLDRPDRLMEPPGAVDYYATFSVTWDPSDEEIDPADAATLAALAERQYGTDELSEYVSLSVGGAHLLVCDLDEGSCSMRWTLGRVTWSTSRAPSWTCVGADCCLSWPTS